MLRTDRRAAAAEAVAAACLDAAERLDVAGPEQVRALAARLSNADPWVALWAGREVLRGRWAAAPDDLVTVVALGVADAAVTAQRDLDVARTARRRTAGGVNTPGATHGDDLDLDDDDEPAGLTYA